MFGVTYDGQGVAAGGCSAPAIAARSSRRYGGRYHESTDCNSQCVGLVESATGMVLPSHSESSDESCGKSRLLKWAPAGIERKL